MIPAGAALTVLFLEPFALAACRSSVWGMRGLALASCALPFLVPSSEPFLKAALALMTWLFVAKTLQFTSGHERPAGFVDMLQFLLIPAVVRWESPRRKDPGRATRSVLSSAGHLALAAFLATLVMQLDRRNPIQLLTTQLGIYLCLSGFLNLAAASLSLRGIDHDDPFQNPLAARTPSEFWGRRWNTWVNYMLYRYVFVPSGGRRHPVRGALLAFAMSATLHEGFVVVGTGEFGGWTAGFFLVQGLIVAGTSQSKAFRTLTRRKPRVTQVLTLISVILTGIMLVRGIARIDPSNAWVRCCE